jgi:predicted nucleotidyltransferase
MSRVRWRLIDDPRGYVLAKGREIVHPIITDWNQLPEDQKKELSIIKEYIYSKISNCELYLFGSRIKGTWNEESDYDIVIVVDEIPNKELIQELQLHNYGVDVDISFSRKEYYPPHLKQAIKI